MQEWGIVALLLNLESGEMSGQLHVLIALPLGGKEPLVPIDQTQSQPGSGFVRVSIKLSRHVININKYTYIYFFLLALRPNAGHGLLIHEVSRSHTATHHSR